MNLRLRPWVLPALAVGAFVVLSLVVMAGESVTADEVVHLPAGYAHLVARDFRLGDPPLPQIHGALALLFTRVHWPSDPSFLERRQQWHFGYSLLFMSGNDPDRLVFLGRLPMLLWGILILLSVHALSTELFGPRGGLISLGVTTFSPLLLAHAHLVKTDVILAAFLVLVVASFRLFAAKPGAKTAIYLGFMLGGAFTSKYSAVVLIPALAALTVLELRRRNGSRRWFSAKRLGLAGIVAGVCFGTVWGVYGFRYPESADPGAPGASWDFGPTSAGITGRAVLLARDARVLPEAYLRGFLDMKTHNDRGHVAFALGELSRTGWWWYFPFAFLVKTPLSALALMAWGALSALRGRKRQGKPLDFLLVPLVLYSGAAILSNLNIGLRHLLPVHPFLSVLAGGVAWDRFTAGGAAAWRRFMPWGLQALLALECLVAIPHFIGYFNAASLAAWERHEMLVDSNLDWGQDLGRLKALMDREGIAEVKLAYFGHASPRHLRLRHQVLPGMAMYVGFEREWKRAGEPVSGDVVAVSASCLAGVATPDAGYYRRRLGRLKPFAKAGHSILLYRIP